MDDEEMKIEANRLQTFVNWSGNVPVEPERIARGGFYATGNELEVQCPWCKSKISEWRFGDIAVMARHRLLDPLCPFVVNPTSSGNTPISSQPTQSEVVPVDLMNEQCRLATFKNWPVYTEAYKRMTIPKIDCFFIFRSPMSHQLRWQKQASITTINPIV